MNSEDLKIRTRQFAHDCIKLARELKYDAINHHLKIQLIRSATSAASNYQAACISQSTQSFIAKLSISIEEIDEVKFWLTFMIEEGILLEKDIKDIMNEANSIANILCRSRITARSNLIKKKQTSSK